MIITQEPLGWSKHRLTEDYNEGLKHWIRISLYCISVTRNNNVVNELKKYLITLNLLYYQKVLYSKIQMTKLF